MCDLAQSGTLKFAINTEDTVLKFKFNICFKIKPYLGTAKARPMLKPSSKSGWDFTPTEQRQWIDIEIQESKDPYCFQGPLRPSY